MVTGTNQAVGEVTGVGATVVADGGSLTVARLVQSSLSLEGSYEGGFDAGLGDSASLPGDGVDLGALAVSPAMPSTGDTPLAPGGGDPPTPTPEPGTLALLVSAALGLAACLRRRKP